MPTTNTQTKNPTTTMVTATELARILKIHRQTVIRMAVAGVIPGLKIGVEGRDWRFDLHAVEEALAVRPLQPSYGAAR